MAYQQATQTRGVGKFNLRQIKNNVSFSWGNPQQVSFNTLKERTQAKGLVLQDFEEMFDAFGVGIAAILHQMKK